MGKKASIAVAIFVGLGLLFSSCVTKRKLNLETQKNNIHFKTQDTLDSLILSQAKRDSSLDSLVTTLPPYDSLKGMDVILDLSVRRVNKKYDADVEKLIKNLRDQLIKLQKEKSKN